MSTRKRILFLRPSLAHGGADKVTVNLLNNIDLSKFDPEIALMHLKGEMQNQLSSSIKVIDLKSSSLWLSIGAIRKTIKQGNYDIIYSTSGGMGIPMMFAARIARFRGTKVVSERSSLQRFSSSAFKKRALLFFKKWMYKHADHVTVVSKAIGEEAKTILNLKDRRIHVVNNPIVGDELFSKGNEEVENKIFKNSPFKIVAVGRLVAIKDFPMLINAFQQFRKESGTGDLFILGKGPLEESLNEMATKMGVSDNVHLLGFQDNPFAYMAKADVFALTSKFEGMPGVLIQSMALGTISISTDCPTGPNEIIEQSENGFLIEIGNSQQLTDLLLEIQSKPNNYHNLKQKARQSVNRFRTEDALESYLSFL